MPRTRQFTERNVAEAKIGRTHVTGIEHLYLFKSPKGATRYLFRYTVPGERRVTETAVGKPGISLNRAKEIADHFNHRLLDGVDPQQMKQWKKNEETTFGQVTVQFIAANTQWSPERRQRVNNLLRVHCEPLWDLPLITANSAVTIRDALLPLDRRSPTQARLVRRLVKRVLDYAGALNLPIGLNQARREVMDHLFPHHEGLKGGNYADMKHMDIPAFIQELRLRQVRATAAIALEFTILTACRSGEVLKARWPEIDWEQKLWNIPAARMKAGREHQVPLCDRALELLRHQEKYAAGCPYVFTGYSRRLPLAEKSMLRLLHRMGYGVTVHGFRGSFKTWTGDETDFRWEDCEKCLARRVGNEVARAYDHSAALERRRKIMDAWANHCAGGKPVSQEAAQRAVGAHR
jgi:integrase